MSASELRPELVAAAIEQLRHAADGLHANACLSGGLSGVAGTSSLAAAAHRLHAAQSRLATEGVARTTQAADQLDRLVGRTQQVDRFGR